MKNNEVTKQDKERQAYLFSRLDDYDKAEIEGFARAMEQHYGVSVAANTNGIWFLSGEGGEEVAVFVSASQFQSIGRILRAAFDEDELASRRRT